MNRRKKNGWMHVIDNLIWAVIGAMCVVVGYLDAEMWLKTVYFVCIGVFAIFYLWFVYYKATNEIEIAAPATKPVQQRNSYISQIVLLNEQNQVLKKWDINGKAGLIIGKNSEENQVDIDLSDTALCALISDEHALLNYTGSCWFLEDYDSEQGTALKKQGETNFTVINKSEPRKIDCGDLICVGKTILQVR